MQRDNINEYVWTSKGISSAVVLTKGIKNILKHKNTTTVVNKRIYGNGFNPRIVRKILDINSDKKIDLIITADHGSNDDEYYIELKNKIKDLKIILTDHHTISKYPKNVDAFINPMREDSTFVKDISGCATAFLLMVKVHQLMFKSKNINFFKDDAKLSILTDAYLILLNAKSNAYFLNSTE